MENQFNHFGVCDASAAVAIDDEHFIVANDEDNILQVYNATQSKSSIDSDSISKMLKLKKEDDEADIEGAARIGDIIYWIGSHSRNSKGKEQSSRHQFFATSLKTIGNSISQLGQSYTSLLLHLKNKFPEIKEATEKKDKDNKDIGAEAEGGFNLEGFAACPDGSVILGFRNPIPKGKAFLVKISNPSELIHDHNKEPLFSEPIRLDLGGRGVRAIAYWAAKQCYLIVGGSYNDDAVNPAEPNFALYKWDGSPSHNPENLNVKLGDLNPEAIVIYPNNKVQLLSDDGGRPIGEGNKPCKDLLKEAKKTGTECKECHFRSLFVDIP